ncbi:hypothetical protein G3I59_45405 [Amycolatopsis rubida]|uniref:Uncharacterized protein n=1 Tax=Amycolatopsis rubida TaxID=112413 RepID=A0ABX0C671_9PSEU|nr:MULTISPECIES: hypothetical protein [Amycolatopsis]NEC62648.1 hypothetical protein [Amycolatopsis rubida]OAP21834.1 hypothetical protein A4R44_07292 [Amycolatopsis sp. M39]
MTVAEPTSEEVREAASGLGPRLSEEECQSCLTLPSWNLEACRALGAMVEPRPENRGGDRKWPIPLAIRLTRGTPGKALC